MNREYTLHDHILKAEFDIAIDDELAYLTAGNLANVIWIESNEYPLPWVGRIVGRHGETSSGLLTVHAESYDAILAERLLPALFTTSSGASVALAAIMGQVERTNPTKIGVGHTDRLSAPPMQLSDALAIAAIEKLVENAGAEWWLSYVYARGGIDVAINLAKERGADFSPMVTLAQPGNFEVLSWDEDNRAIAYAQTVVGGATNVLEAYSERERATATRDTQFNRRDSAASQVAVEGQRVFRFGHVIAGETSFRAPTQRRERLAVREELREAGLTPAAAEALLSRQDRTYRTLSGRVLPDVEGEQATSWKYLEPGNVVWVSSSKAFGSGYEGVATVVGVQPMEHERFMDIELELA